MKTSSLGSNCKVVMTGSYVQVGSATSVLVLVRTTPPACTTLCLPRTLPTPETTANLSSKTLSGVIGGRMTAFLFGDLLLDFLRYFSPSWRFITAAKYTGWLVNLWRALEGRCRVEACHRAGRDAQGWELRTTVRRVRRGSSDMTHI